MGWWCLWLQRTEAGRSLSGFTHLYCLRSRLRVRGFDLPWGPQASWWWNLAGGSGAAFPMVLSSLWALSLGFWFLVVLYFLRDLWISWYDTTTNTDLKMCHLGRRPGEVSQPSNPQHSVGGGRRTRGTGHYQLHSKFKANLGDMRPRIINVNLRGKS